MQGLPCVWFGAGISAESSFEALADKALKSDNACFHGSFIFLDEDCGWPECGLLEDLVVECFKCIEAVFFDWESFWLFFFNDGFESREFFSDTKLEIELYIMGNHN